MCSGIRQTTTQRPKQLYLGLVELKTFGQIFREEEIGGGAYRQQPPSLALLESMKKKEKNINLGRISTTLTSGR